MSTYNVIHILPTSTEAGTSIARIVAALTVGLKPMGYQIHAWFLSPGGPLCNELDGLGARIRTFNWNSGDRDFVAWAKILEALWGENFDIIHQHVGGRSFAWLAKMATNAKLIIHLHGREIETRGPTPVPVVLPSAFKIIATSHAVSQMVIDQTAYVVYPGINTSATHFMRSGIRENKTETIIGTARRLVATKGVIHLIRAFAQLRREMKDLFLEIAGSGTEQHRLESEVRALGLTNCVAFLGWQKDLSPLFKRWDIFVIPSLEEGFGVAALEAMNAGLPVIASAVGGLPELVENNRTGFLVPPADPDALANCLRSLLLDAERRHAMGCAGQARAWKSFSADRMVCEIARIYDEAVGKR